MHLFIYIYQNANAKCYRKPAPSEPITHGNVYVQQTGSICVDHLVLCWMLAKKAQVLFGVKNTSFSHENETNYMVW